MVGRCIHVDAWSPRDENLEAETDNQYKAARTSKAYYTATVAYQSLLVLPDSTIEYQLPLT